METKKITATLHKNYGIGRFWSDVRECGEYPETVRVSIPKSLADATTAGCRQVDTGYVLLGTHRGRRWGIVALYNMWVNRDNACNGDTYIAFDLDNAKDREMFAKIEET